MRGPSHQLGYLKPVPVVDTIHYQFYQVFGPAAILIAAPMYIESFTVAAAIEAFDGFWPGFEFLVKRGADRIVQGGIPVSALAGRKLTNEVLAQARERTTVPVTADFEEVIEALMLLGARKVALAAKWDDLLMGKVAEYLADAGIGTVGAVAEAHSASQVIEVQSEAGIEMALALGRKALHDFPSADALLLAGGAWISTNAVPILEAEFGKPVVTNPNATYWAGLRQFGLKCATPGLGRLLEGASGTGG
jgi:maleate cis-trans isomerase